MLNCNDRVAGQGAAREFNTGVGLTSLRFGQTAGENPSLVSRHRGDASGNQGELLGISNREIAFLTANEEAGQPARRSNLHLNMMPLAVTHKIRRAIAD